MQFENMARKTIETECEDYYFGIADLSDADESETQKYGSLLDNYPKAISIGISWFNINPLCEGLNENDSEIRDMADQKVDNISSKIIELLQKRGYDAFQVPVIETNEKLFLYLHKMAARMAGLNQIEINQVKDLKNRHQIKWSTILTNAPL